MANDDDSDNVKILYKELITNRMDFIPRGDQNVELVYQLVKDKYPELCNDNYRCNEHHKSEWTHRVQTALQVLGIESVETGVRRFK